MKQKKQLHRTFFNIFCFFFTLAAAAPAYGIRLVYVKHLFDITHGFEYPSDVSVSGDGRIHVVDGVNNRIKIFNPAGKFISAFGGKGSADGQFRQPLGIDIDGANRIYIADSGNHRIQIFEPGGKFLAKVEISSNFRRKTITNPPCDLAIFHVLKLVSRG